MQPSLESNVPRPGAVTAPTRTGKPLVVLAGNPNTGKTSLFNRLTGQQLKVGNYPGVTVERHEARLVLGGGRSALLLDVPGTYSLSSRSAEEQIAVMAVAGLPPHPRPDLVLLVVDATQLTRNLYFALQVLEIGAPVVIALTMVDLLERRGETLDRKALEEELGVPVVPFCGTTGSGAEELRSTIDAALDHPESVRSTPPWMPSDAALRSDIEHVARALPEAWAGSDEARRQALASWALLSLDEEDELVGVPDELRGTVLERRRSAEAAGRELEREIIEGRYTWIDRHAPRFVQTRDDLRGISERVDAVLLHPVAGFAIFLAVMGVVFQSLFTWSDPAIRVVEGAFGWLGERAASLLGDGLVADFVIGGLIAGMGSVLVFLPQILLLFFFIGLLEDTGYMARVAFLMDRIMKRLGLHGRAFVPMLSGFACAIPAIMATRTMERRRDRMLTMMVVPLMTCSARLPVYTLLIAAFFPPAHLLGFVPVQGLLMVAMYLFSTVVALAALAVLGRTLFKGPRVPLLLELPPYRRPQLASVLRMMWSRGKLFLTEAGGVILVCTILLWGLLYFPRGEHLAAEFDAQREALVEQELSPEVLDERLAELDAERQGAHLRQSYGARLGHWIEPTIEPLGFDWKIGVGLIGAFAAREVFISTMGIVYGAGDSVDEESATLRERMAAERRNDGRPVYSPLVALSLMVFFALACQCMSTLAAVYRETHSWRWPTFLFFYMTALAWLASFAVYQGGRLFGFE